MLYPRLANLPFCRILPRPVLVILLWITGSFQVFFFPFLFNDFRNSGNIRPRFGKDSLHIFKIARGTHIDQKQFACNVVAHVVGPGLLLQWKILVSDLKPQEITIEALYISNNSLLTNLHKIPTVCGQTCLLFRGSASLGAIFTRSPMAR